jgi:hypothetical protein
LKKIKKKQNLSFDRSWPYIEILSVCKAVSF